jgi:hypothetical protein
MMAASSGMKAGMSFSRSPVAIPVVEDLSCLIIVQQETLIKLTILLGTVWTLE